MKDQPTILKASLSRRQLLKALGIGATGMALTACVAPAPAGEAGIPAQETVVISIDHRSYAEGTAGGCSNR